MKTKLSGVSRERRLDYYFEVHDVYIHRKPTCDFHPGFCIDSAAPLKVQRLDFLKLRI